MASNSNGKDRFNVKAATAQKTARLAPGLAAASMVALTFSADAQSEIPVQVSEPGSMALLAGGIAGLACAKALARRRKK